MEPNTNDYLVAGGSGDFLDFEGMILDGVLLDAYFVRPFPAWFPFNAYGREIAEVHFERARSEADIGGQLGPLVVNRRHLLDSFPLYLGDRTDSVGEIILQEYDGTATEGWQCGGLLLELLPANDVAMATKVIREWERLAAFSPTLGHDAAVIRLVAEDRASLTGIAYCETVKVGTILGPPSECRVVYLNDAGTQWLLAVISPFVGPGCGMGEVDAVCAWPKELTEVEAKTRLRRALVSQPLLLDVFVASDREKNVRIVGKRRYLPSSVFPTYREHAVVVVDVASSGEDFGISTTVLLSRQNVGDVSQMRGVSRAEQSTYNRALLANLAGQGLNCHEAADQ